jgi:hypothetical protein
MPLWHALRTTVTWRAGVGEWLEQGHESKPLDEGADGDDEAPGWGRVDGLYAGGAAVTKGLLSGAGRCEHDCREQHEDGDSWHGRRSGSGSGLRRPSLAGRTTASASR